MPFKVALALVAVLVIVLGIMPQVLLQYMYF
jgi:hypothetical protein